MIELALLAALVVAGAVALFVVSIRVGMLIGRRLDGWLQVRYEAEQAAEAEAAEAAGPDGGIAAPDAPIRTAVPEPVPAPPERAEETIPR